MIKIEIIDPCKENPDVLVKTAAYLMELAGHKMIKAPTKEEWDRMGNPQSPIVLTTDELPGPRGHGECTGAPYQHCGISEDFAPIDDKQLGEIKAYSIDECIQDTVNEHVKHMIDNGFTPSSPTIEEKPKPKRNKKSSGAISTPPAPIAPLEEIIEPPPITPVNFHMVTSKIVSAIKEGKITQEEINLILGNHGLVQLKDLHTAPHAIEPINKDLDQALRGK